MKCNQTDDKLAGDDCTRIVLNLNLNISRLLLLVNTAVDVVLESMGVGKMRNCGMRKVKCGTDRAEKYRGMVCNLRNAENHYHSQN